MPLFIQTTNVYYMPPCVLGIGIMELYGESDSGGASYSTIMLLKIF